MDRKDIWNEKYLGWESDQVPNVSTDKHYTNY